MTIKYSPDRGHRLKDVDVGPSRSGRGNRAVIVGWFTRIWFTGDEVRDFRGERCEVVWFESEIEARRYAAEIRHSAS